MISGSAKRDDLLRVASWRGGAERRPLLHEPTPLLEHVTPLVGLLDFAADRMRQACLDNFILS
jgi:hypothetical protein